nr:hypothetical protein 4 [bacterium]
MNLVEIYKLKGKLVDATILQKPEIAERLVCEIISVLESMEKRLVALEGGEHES